MTRGARAMGQGEGDTSQEGRATEGQETWRRRDNGAGGQGARSGQGDRVIGRQGEQVYRATGRQRDVRAGGRGVRQSCGHGEMETEEDGDRVTGG